MNGLRKNIEEKQQLKKKQNKWFIYEKPKRLC